MVKRKLHQPAKNAPRMPVCWDLSQILGIQPTGPTPDGPFENLLDQDSACGPTAPPTDLPSSSSSTASSSTTSSTDYVDLPPPNPYSDGYYLGDDNFNPLVPSLVDIFGEPNDQLELEVPAEMLFHPAQNECGFIPSDSLCLGLSY